MQKKAERGEIICKERIYEGKISGKKASMREKMFATKAICGGKVDAKRPL